MGQGSMLLRFASKLEREYFFYQKSYGTEKCTLEKINVLSVVEHRNKSVRELST